MKAFLYILVLFFFFTGFYGEAQPITPLYATDAIKINRIKQHDNSINRTIVRNLSLPLSDSTESYWQDAFDVMELMRYKPSWVNYNIVTAFDSIHLRSRSFQRSLMEFVYANYKDKYTAEVNQLMTVTSNEKIFAMCSEYLLRNDSSEKNVSEISLLLSQKFSDTSGNAILYMLKTRLQEMKDVILKKNVSAFPQKILPEILSRSAFPNAVVVYSFQRRNRDFPGLAIVRDKTGKFVKDEKGNIFSVPQLARSMSGLPVYLTNGNTPQGVYRMDGFEVSKSRIIGPTPNIQLTMPFEGSIAHFIRDSSNIDSVWTIDLYKKILPDSWKNFSPFFQTYYASKAGRTEIIAHGTTIDPKYYQNESYYPLTPTEGCLCTKEIWSEDNGIQLESDQIQLVNAVKKAGGADGYLVVIDLDNFNQRVSLTDILTYLPKNN